jgi:PAS domain S-box-containing protein
MGELMRTYDWERHPLGNPRQWPLSLQTGVRMMLLSGYPMFIWWSADLYMFHNDAYAPTFVGRHGEVLGAEARRVWADVWEQLGGIIEDILAKGTTFYAEDMRVIPERKGFREETYWTFSYSPMPDDSGRVNGIFCACSDVTEKVLSQRRLNALQQLSEGISSWQTTKQVLAYTAQVLAGQGADIPFAAFYLPDHTGKAFHLEEQTGPEQKLPVRLELPVSAAEAHRVLGQETSPQANHLISYLQAQLPILHPAHPAKDQTAGASATASPQAVVLPLVGQHQLQGFLVAGVSPMLEYNPAYGHFHHLLARQLTGALEGVAARQREQQQAQALQAGLQAERNRLYSLFEQAPVAISILQGAQYVIDLANPAVLQLWGRTRPQVLGKPLFEALPEVRQQGFEDLLAGVRTSGKPYVGQELPVQMDRWGRRETVYFNFVYHPLRDAAGTITSIAVVATEVTSLAMARQREEENARQLQALNEELTAANEEIKASYEELHASNEELLRSRYAMEQLNAQLETRVALRTEQLQLARQQAEKQRVHIYQLFMQAPAGIALLQGADLVYQMANQTYYQILGRDAQILGQPGREAFPEGVAQGIWDLLDGVYASGEPYVGEGFKAMIDMDGSGTLTEQYYDFVFQPVREGGQQVTGILITALNVTHQVVARREVEKQARRLKLLTDALPVLIGYLDKEEKYRFANQAYQAWFGQNPEDLLGRPIREVVGEKAYAGVKEYIARALAGERLDFEAKMPYREDFVKYIRTSYVPDIREGEVAGFYTLVQDITEPVLARQQVEQSQQALQALNAELAAANGELSASNGELARINEDLDRTNKDLDNFVYTASHDLKAPILNVEGLLRALEKQLDAQTLRQESVQQIYGLLYRSVNRFKSTIGDLTEVARISKETTEDVVSIPLAGVLEEVLQDLAPQLEEGGTRVDIRLHCPEVHFSRKNLKSVLYNLVSNAVKYRSPDRKSVVTITCRAQENYYILVVEDNGLGMDMRQQDKIFALFKRLHNHVEGTGIGLYIVKKILENAGGKIEVESQVGVGSTFKAYFKR